MEQTSIKQNRRRTITGITLSSLFAALIAAGTFIAVPLPFSPVPIVLQNLFALLAGLVLGPVLGSAAAGIFLVAGAIGAPVFAGGTGGIAHFAGPTGGFLVGYFLAALTAGLIAGRPRAGKACPLWRVILAVFAGLLIIYVPGVIRLKFAIDKPWAVALASGFIPFVIGDLVKGVTAALIAPRLRRAAADQLDR